MLPLSVSGFGLREGSLIFMLGPYGVPASAAVALSLLFFSRRLALGGLGLLFEIKDSLRSRAREPKQLAMGQGR
jgi:glycosyltransferase 2 family protein